MVLRTNSQNIFSLQSPEFEIQIFKLYTGSSALHWQLSFFCRKILGGNTIYRYFNIWIREYWISARYFDWDRTGPVQLVVSKELNLTTEGWSAGGNLRSDSHKTQLFKFWTDVSSYLIVKCTVSSISRLWCDLELGLTRLLSCLTRQIIH